MVERQVGRREVSASVETETVAEGILFGEGPRWHAGHFYFSDIGGKRVHRLSARGALETVVEVPQRPSGLGWRPDGTLLIVSMHDYRLMSFDGQTLREIADLSEWCGGPMNDMVVDAEGRAYVGNIGFDMEAQPLEVKSTHLVRVDLDGSARSVADDLVAPNGMVITPDGGTLIVGESGRACLTAFDLSPKGDLSGRRNYATLPGGAVPDGICLDAEGAIWSASPTTNEFVRIREGGDVLGRISSGGRPAIACMLGGEDRRTLYLITAPTASIESSIPLAAGRIETTRVAVPGAGRP
jgi:sugar lactone lactonase YvrE